MSITLRRFLHQFLSISVAPVIRYFTGQVQISQLNTALYELAWRNAIRSSLQYADENMLSALMFKFPTDLWNYALQKISIDGTCAEFGVWRGRSINHFAKRLHKIYGFDSFEGLREDWSGWGFAKGAFDLGGKMPRVARNVQLVKGWFDETVPEFLERHPESFSFVHIDCDTFESATLVLELIGSRLVPGTVIVFDEYFGYRGWQIGGEFKAWGNYVQRTGTRYEYLAFSSQQVAIRLV